MIARLVFLTEIVAIIIGLYGIFGQKVRVDIGFIAITLLSMVVEETIIGLGIEDVSAIIFGGVYFVFCKLAFKRTFLKTVLGIVLLYILLTLLQVVSLILTYIVIPNNEVARTFCVNLEIVLLSIFLLPRLRIDKTIDCFKLKNKYVMLLFVLVGTTVFLILLQSKFLNGIRADWFLVLVPTIIFLSIVLGKWNVSLRTIDEMKLEKETIKRMQYKYENLIEDVRMRQHEFKNHITAILSTHYTYKTYEQLVRAQEEYCIKLHNENKYNNLLLIENNILAGFLYEKFQEIEENQISIEYKINGNLKNVVLPTYYLIEMVGILVNNAIEASENTEDKKIYVEICGDEMEAYFTIRNKNRYVSYSEIERWFQSGISSKKGERGVGLFHLKKLCEEWKVNILFKNVIVEDKNWIQFTIVIDKRMDNQD